MKKLITVLLALGAMLSTSCKDDVDFEGGGTFRDMYRHSE